MHQASELCLDHDALTQVVPAIVLGQVLGRVDTRDHQSSIGAIKQNQITSLAAMHAFNKAASKDIMGKTAKTS